MARSFVIGTTALLDVLLAVLFSFAAFEDVRDAVFLTVFDGALQRVRDLAFFGERDSPVDLAKIISDWLAIINLPYSILFGLNLPFAPPCASSAEDDPFSDLSFATF